MGAERKARTAPGGARNPRSPVWNPQLDPRLSRGASFGQAPGSCLPTGVFSRPVDSGHRTIDDLDTGSIFLVFRFGEITSADERYLHSPESNLDSHCAQLPKRALSRPASSVGRGNRGRDEIP